MIVQKVTANLENDYLVLLRTLRRSEEIQTFKRSNRQTINSSAFVNAKLIFSLQADVMDYLMVRFYTCLCDIFLQLF
jgi:hypothetical protein